MLQQTVMLLHLWFFMRFRKLLFYCILVILILLLGGLLRRPASRHEQKEHLLPGSELRIFRPCCSRQWCFCTFRVFMCFRKLLFYCILVILILLLGGLLQRTASRHEQKEYLLPGSELRIFRPCCSKQWCFAPFGFLCVSANYYFISF